MNSRQGLIILIAILLLLSMGTGYTAYKAFTERNDLLSKNEKLNDDIDGISKLKDRLAAEVDSLETAYMELTRENESLQESKEVVQRRLAEKNAIINRIKKQSASEANNLKGQIEMLLATKNVLEARINNLQSENDSLRMVTGQLTADLASAQSENEALAALNANIQEDLKRLSLANFRAGAFRVEVERKNPRVTSKSRKARRLRVSFDLTKVISEYQGVRPLYLVVTDDKATPIKTTNPINAKVTVNGQEMDIIAAKKQTVDIEANQRLEFIHDLEDKLRPGYYRVAVYTDIGMLGAASFKLR